MSVRQFLTCAGLVVSTVVVAGCGSSTSPSVHVDGSTQAWFQGATIQLDYTQNFQCKNPPAAASASGCEVGDSAQTIPPGSASPLWVMVPLFTPAPAASTLQCPITGSCVDHPADLDLSTYLSAVFGANAGKTPLPPHSHIIDDEEGKANVPWPIKVVGVLDSTTWNAVVDGKSLATVRTLQASDPTLAGSATGVGTHITVDIPSNLFLFFKVH